MPLVEPIRVEGLKQFTRGLKQLDADLPKAVRLAANEAANLVVREAKPRVPIGPDKGGHAASSLKAASTRTAARVQAGGKRFSYYPWLDFGGHVGRGHKTRRPFFKEGRYIWKAFADHRAEVTEKLTDELVKVAKSAGLEVS